MKILHTADWHLGLKSWRTEKEVDRREEIRASLEQILEGAKKEEVDLIIVAGDVLHENRNPSAESLTDLMEYLSKFSKVAPTVVVLGNHDWKGLKSYSYIARDYLYIFDRNQRVEIDTNSGKISVCSIPYVRDILHPDKENFSVVDFITGIMQDYADSGCNVLVSHLMVEMSGVVPPSVEDRISVILRPEHFSAAFDYVALGHIHKHVVIKKVPYVVYSGSIIQNDFSEWTDVKGYVIYEDGDIRFVRINHKRLGVLDLTAYDDFTVVRRKIEESFENFDYIKVKIKRSLAHYIGNIYKYDKVKSVAIDSREEKKIAVREEVEGMDFYEILENYIRSRISKDLLEEAINLINSIKDE